MPPPPAASGDTVPPAAPGDSLPATASGDPQAPPTSGDSLPATASGDQHPTHASGDFVLALDFGGTKVALGAATLDGRIVESSRLDTRAAQGAAQAVRRALERAGELMERAAQTTCGRCLAVGAVSPGIVRADRVLLAPNVPGWGELSLPATVARTLGVPRVEYGNDVKAAALAEARWGSLRGADPGVLLSLGTGVATGIVVGGAVLGGAHGAAGEIGYSLRSPDGGPGAADGRAPLEERVGGRAMGELGSRLLGAPLDAAQVFANEDARARSLVDGALAELAMHVANLAILVDPERIAVGGGLMSSSDLIMPALAERLCSAVPFPPELVPARFVHDGPLRGAVALALDGVPAEVAP
jgi:predicted NBD/HSP70 family sugar kinase